MKMIQDHLQAVVLLLARLGTLLCLRWVVIYDGLRHAYQGGNCQSTSLASSSSSRQDTDGLLACIIRRLYWMLRAKKTMQPLTL